MCTKDYEYYFNIVKDNPYKINDVPDEYLDGNMIDMLLEKDYGNIFYLIKDESDKILKRYIKYFDTVQKKNIYQVWKCGESIANIPEEQIDRKLAEFAITCGNDQVLDFVGIPKKYLDYDFYMLSMKSGGYLEKVPEQFIDYQLALTASVRNNFNLEYIPIKYRSKGFYNDVMSQSPSALRYLPEAQKTYDLCFQAITKGQGSLLAFVPEVLKDEKICLLALKKDGRVISCCPEYLKTPELLKKVVNSCATAIESLRDDQKTYEMCLKVVNVNHRFMKYVPVEFRDRNMYLSAFSGLNVFYDREFDFNNFLDLLPEIYKTEEFYYDAIKMRGDLIGYKPYFVNDSFYTEEVYNLAVSVSGQALKFVPLKFWTEEMLKIAVQTRQIEHSPSVLSIIVDICNNNKNMAVYLTEELCALSVKKNPSTIKFVPLKFRDINTCKLVVNRIKNWQHYFSQDVIDTIEKEKEEKELYQVRKKEKQQELIENIVEIFSKNPLTTKTEIMKKFSLSDSTAYKILRQLRTLGKVPDYQQPNQVQDKIVDILKISPMKRKDIIIKLGNTEKTIETALTKLKKKGLVINNNGIWQLTKNF